MIECRIISVTLGGFGVFDEPMTVPLDVGAGLYLVSGRNELDPGLGSNGSGKSSLWDAVIWCLYGYSSTGLKAPDLHSWNSKRQMFVEVAFSGYTLRREWNPNRLLLSGVEVESFSSVVPITYVGALSSLLFGQDTGSFLDLCHQDKTQFVSEALSLEKWSTLSDLAGKRALDVKKEISAAEVSLVELRGNLRALSTVKLKEDLKSWDSAHYDDVRLATRAFLEAVMDYKETLQVTEAAATALASATEQRRLAAAAYDSNKQTILSTKQRLDLTRQQKEQKSAILHSHDDKLVFLQTTKRCPCCGMFLSQKYSDRNIASVQADIEAASRVVDRLSMKEKLLVSKLNQRYEASDSLHRALVSAEASERAASLHHTEVLSILAEIDRSQAGLEARMHQLEQEVNPYLSQLQDIKQRKRDAQSASVALVRQKEALVLTHAETEFWVQGFRDIRLNLIQDVLAHLSIVTTSKMESMGMVGWSVLYDIDALTKSGTVKKGFAVQVKSPTSPDFVPWEAWSGGERQRIRIAATLALSDVLLSAAGITFDFEIWDEPSTYITEEGFESFLQQLHGRAIDLKKRIFLTDHRQLDSGYFGGELRITKREGGTSAQWIF